MTRTLQFQTILNEINTEILPLLGTGGAVATYMPALARVSPLQFGLCGEAIHIDPEVAHSEADTGFRNAALANFMKAIGTLDNTTAQVLEVYFNQCAISMSCVQVARAARFLCRDGAHPYGGAPVITEAQTRRINALMLTCGTYDAAGEFAFRIGLPCKTGPSVF